MISIHKPSLPALPLLALLGAVSLCEHDCIAAEPPSVATVISIIESMEARFNVIEWKFHTTEVTGLESGGLEPAAREGSPFLVKGFVRWDPATQRYFADFDSILRWQNGLAPFIAAHRQMSYDGELFRFWERTQPGSTLPEFDDRANGAISESSKEAEGAAFYNAWLIESGIAFVPPLFPTFVEPPSRLSNLLRSQQEAGRPLDVAVNSDGTWRFRTTMHFDDGDPFELRIWYDPNKGCVSRAEWGGGNPDVVWRRYDADLAEVQDGVWVPRECRLTQELQTPPVTKRIVLTDFTMKPNLSQDAFRVTFPPGTRVDDHVEDRSYLVGPAVAKEPEQIRKFIDANDLSPDGKGSAQTAYAWRHRLIWINGIALICIAAAVLVIWKLRSKTPPSAGAGRKLRFLIPLLLFPGTSSAETGNVDASAISYSSGEHIRISQCGVTVSIFACELFGVKYNELTLAASLPATRDGISMQDVRNVLEAHGLSVQARAHLTVEDLEQPLRSGMIAILPLQSDRHINHYFVAMTDKNNQAVLVDVPIGIRPLREALGSQALVDSGGLALFVSRRTNAGESTPLGEKMDVDPPVINLGTFPIDGPTASVPIDGSIVVRNTTDQAIMVCSVDTSCSCTKPEWVGGVLKAGQTQHVDFKIIPGAWGEGFKHQAVVMKFPDGSKKEVKIIGTGMTASKIQDLVIKPERIDIDAQQLEPGSAPHFRAKLEGDGASLARLTVMRQEQWLVANLIEIDKESSARQLEVTFDLSNPAVAAVAIGNIPELRGTILISDSGDESMPAIPVGVRLYCRPLVIEPRIVEVLRMETKSVDLRVISPGRKKSDIEIKDFDVNSAPISVELDGRSDKGQSISITANADALPGYYSIRCIAGLADGKSSTGTFIVHIR